jgi:hypothetical protein
LTRLDPRLVVGAYVAIVAIALIRAMTYAEFWDHPMAWVAEALWIGVLFALVRHRRWAWWILVVFTLIGVALDVISFPGPGWFALTIVTALLLLSPQMREHVAPRDRRPRRRRDHPTNDDFLR